SLSPAEEARWSPLTPKQAESLLKKFEARLGFRPDAEMTQQIVDTGVALESLDSFANLLVHSEVKDAEFLRPVLSRLRHMTQKSDKRGISGNYFNWTTRLALRAIVHRQNRRDLREWIHHMDRGGSLAEHEAMLARILPGVQLQGARAYSPKYLAGKVAKSIQAVLRRVPLNLESIYTVLRFLDTQERMGESLLRKLPERDVWDVLEMFLDERPGMRPFMEGQLKEVAESPAGYLRFHRLYRLMLHEPFQDSKFRELAAKDFVLRPVTREGQAKESFTKNVADSIYDGYVNHRTLSLYLGDLYQHQAMLTDPMRVREARIERNAAIRRVWPENGPLTQEKIVQLLEELGDPISHRVARAVRAGEVEIKVMLNREFNDFVEKHNADQPGYLTSAVFAPRALTGEPDALIIRQVDLVSHEVFPEMAFRRIQSVIHEFEHFEEPPASPRTPSATFREEMTAHARTLYWRAIHGDIAELEQMQRESSQSLGMTLRDRVDSWYLPQPKD
ncbi:MAG: hypothetical protein R3257_05565, partial [bacterium]|nr:hypothetical protein [bacterium]